MIKKFIKDSLEAIQEAYDSVTEVDPKNVYEFQEDPTDAELAEAFRELAVLRSQSKKLRTSLTNMTEWIKQMKADAGYPESASFDDIFTDLLEFYNKNKGKDGY